MLEKELLELFEKTLVGAIIDHTKLGTGKIISIGHYSESSIRGADDVTVNVEFTDGHIVELCIFRCLNKIQNLKININVDNLEAELLKYDEARHDLEDKLAEEYEEQRKLEWEKKKEQEAEEKRKLKFEQKREHDINSFRRLISGERSINFNNYYSVIGWLAKHTSVIRAQVPDYLENMFIHEFGENANFEVFDSQRRTDNGFLYHFGLSLQLSLVKVDTIPEYIQDIVKNNKICNNEFVFPLLRDFGFKLAKQQDINSIIDEIPAAHLEEFKAGLNA